MNTLIIVATLFSVQPATVQSDSQWFDLQSMREQVRAYVIEDVANVNHVISAALREGIIAASKFGDQQSDTATLVAQKEKAINVKQPQSQVN